jgi:group I intron endonuclease
MNIYKIQNKINGKIYIGQTRKSLNERISGHLISNSYIGRALRKYGLQCFDISIIDMADTKEWLNGKEMEYIAFYDCKHPNGYNLTDGGEGTIGLSEEALEKRRISNTGKKRSEETKQKMRKPHKILNPRGPHTEETKKKISNKNRGKKRIPMKQETKNKISIALIGNKNPLGSKHTEEQLKKMRTPRSEEARKNMQGPKKTKRR